MRNAAANEALEKTLSRERLEKYLHAAKQDLDHALELYELNTKISEAFYTLLQCVEICLRNSIDIQLTKTYGDRWFDVGSVPFNNESRGAISNVIKGLVKDARAVTRGRVVAELKFAFWVSVLAKQYDATLWRDCVYRAFEKGSRRSDVHGRFNAIRRFRNRIAHHEPVFHRPCSDIHQEIIEALGWMCPHTARWAASHSRFPAVMAAAAAATDPVMR